MIVCVLGQRQSTDLTRLLLISRQAHARVCVRSNMRLVEEGTRKVDRGAPDVEVQTIEIKPYEAKSLVIRAPPGTYYEVEPEDVKKSGPFRVPSCPESKCVLQNCDADDHLRVTSTWESLHDMEYHTAFHIGDQIYHDYQFCRMLNFLRRRRLGAPSILEPGVRRVLYENYIRSWTRPLKVRLLAERHNFMIGDDHEISDDAWVSARYQGQAEFKFLRKVAVDVYREIQGGLRSDPLTAHDDFACLSQGDAIVILIGRMYNIHTCVDEYVNYITSELEAHRGAFSRLVVIFTRPPLNRQPISLSCCRRRPPVGEDFEPLWDLLQGFRRASGIPVQVFGGDLHLAQTWEFTPKTAGEGEDGFTLINVPAMASCVPTFPPTILSGVERSSKWNGRLVSQTKANGFCTLDLKTGVANTWVSRYISHMIRNEMYVGAREVWCRLTEMEIPAA